MSKIVIILIIAASLLLIYNYWDITERCEAINIKVSTEFYKDSQKVLDERYLTLCANKVSKLKINTVEEVPVNVVTGVINGRTEFKLPVTIHMSTTENFYQKVLKIFNETYKDYIKYCKIFVKNLSLIDMSNKNYTASAFICNFNRTAYVIYYYKNGAIISFRVYGNFEDIMEDIRNTLILP